MYARYDRKTLVSRQLFKIINDDCFQKVTASAVHSVHPSFPATLPDQTAVFEHCLVRFPAECLAACNAGAHLNLANGTLPSSVAGEFPAKMFALAVTNHETQNRQLAVTDVDLHDGSFAAGKEPQKFSSVGALVWEKAAPIRRLGRGSSSSVSEEYRNPLVEQILTQYNTIATKHNRRTVRVLSAFEHNGLPDEKDIESHTPRKPEERDRDDPDPRHAGGQHGLARLLPPFVKSFLQKSVEYTEEEIDDSQPHRDEHVQPKTLVNEEEEVTSGRQLQRDGAAAQKTDCEQGKNPCDCARLAPNCGWQRRPNAKSENEGRCRPAFSGSRRYAVTK